MENLQSQTNSRDCQNKPQQFQTKSIHPIKHFHPNIEPCIPGFEHIKRYWHDNKQHVEAKVLPGEFYVSAQGEMITTVLGSCISVCAYDPITATGGMNHFMLPSGNEDMGITSKSFRFGDVAMERMINEIVKKNIDHKRLIFKAFGGGRMLSKMSDIGGKNIEFLHRYMEMEKLRLASSDLGGPHPREVQFFTNTGKVLVKRLERLHSDTIARQENHYGHQVDEQIQGSGDVELFD